MKGTKVNKPWQGYKYYNQMTFFTIIISGSLFQYKHFCLNTY